MFSHFVPFLPKTLTFFLILLTTSQFLAPAASPQPHGHGQPPTWGLQLHSFETEASGTLDLPVSLYRLQEDGKMYQPHLLPQTKASGPVPDWLKHWRITQMPSLWESRKVGGKAETVVTLSYDSKMLPFSYQRMKVTMLADDHHLGGSLTFFLYFTPYGTVEVWNEEDFENLNRRWDSPSQAAQRQPLKRSSLPPEAWSKALFRGETKPTRALSIPGLAYTIPLAEPAQVPEPSSLTKAAFSGSVDGNVVVNVSTGDLAVSGIAVEVWEANTLGDTLLAVGYTDDSGAFDINILVSGSSSPSMHVYLVLVSHNAADTLRVRTRLGVIRNETFFRKAPAVFYNGVPHDHHFGTISMDRHQAKPQLLHRANRARQFVDQALPGFLPTDPSERLDIMKSFSGSSQAYFFPGGYTWDLIFVSAAVFGYTAPVAAAVVGGVGALFISNNDAIYFGEGEELGENTVYHEFGHYLMWQLQNESWADILDASFATHFLHRNNPNPKLSWTEGFATGFANMVDTWCQADDGEFGEDDFGDYETRYRHNADFIEDVPDLSHGFVSEWNVGCVLYDLWDGPTQTLQNGSVLTAGYDDAGLDQTQLSFAQIVQPLLNHQGTGGFHMDPLLFGFLFENNQEQYLLTTIVEYHNALLKLPEMDCSFAKEVTDLFNDDSVRNFYPTSMVDLDLMTSDFLAFTRSVTTQRYDASGAPNGFATHAHRVDVPALLKEDDSFHVAKTAIGPQDLFLSDDLLVTGTVGQGSASLMFNVNQDFGWFSPNNSYDASANSGLAAIGHLDIDLCGDMVLEVNEGAKVQIGAPSGITTATVRLKSGSTLILGGDDTGQILDTELTYGTLVSMGTLEIANHSRFIVEPGATLIFNRGGNIRLPGINSVLEIHGNLVVSKAANFRPDGNGKVIFGLPNLGGAPNVTVDNDSVIQFFELDIELLGNTYLRPNNHPGFQFIMQFSTGQFGPDSYISSGTGMLYVEYFNVFPSQPQTHHQGLWVDAPDATMDHLNLQGGNPGVWAKHPSAVAQIRDSHFTHCTQAILVESGGINFRRGSISLSSVAGIEGMDAGIYVEEVQFQNNVTGIYTDGGGGSLDQVSMSMGNYGWYAYQPTGTISVNNSQIFNHVEEGMLIVGAGTQALLDHVELEQNKVGLKVDGPMLARLTCSRVISNREAGLWMQNGAFLDLSNQAYATIENNPINLNLVDAAEPRLDQGHNRWHALVPGDWNIRGTISGGLCACTPVAGGGCAAPWTFTNISGNLNFSRNTFTAPGGGNAIEIRDRGTGNCLYTPFPTNATLACP